MGHVGRRSAGVSMLELSRQWLTSMLIVALLFVARRLNALALSANRRGRHSGSAGSASRALAHLSTRLYEAESIRRKGF